MKPESANPAISAPPCAVSADQTRWFADEVQPCDPQLRAYLRKSLPCPADADDTAQDCYLRLLRAKENGRVRSTKPLLFAIARNAVRDFFKRRARAEVVPITETSALPVLEGERGLVETICHDQEIELLTEAINSLPDRQREVVLLRKIKNLPQKEIAALLGISENTVESLASKGAHRIADHLRAKGVLPSHESRR